MGALSTSKKKFLLLVTATTSVVAFQHGLTLGASTTLKSHVLSPRLLNWKKQVGPLAAKKKGKKNASKNFPPKNNNQGKQMVQEQKFDDITRQYAFTLAGVTKKTADGSRTLLDKIDLGFLKGAKIGVVGPNGAGKSTLIKIMAGLDADFDGIAKRGSGMSVGYLAQEPVLRGVTVGDAVDDALKESKSILERFEQISRDLAASSSSKNTEAALLEELEAVQEKIDAKDLWDLDRRVSRALSALRCPPEDAELKSLSGGETRRVALASLILKNHDMLLLDEPTNHLDAESVAWLEGYLCDFPGTVVLVTHDRYFLDRVTRWILELDQGRGLPFEGSYAQWLAHKAKQLGGAKTKNKAEEEDAAQSASPRLAALLAELRAFRDRAASSSVDDADAAHETTIVTGTTPTTTPSKTRIAAYESRLAQALSASASGSEVLKRREMFVPSGPRLGADVIKATNLTKMYGPRVLFEDVSFEIPRAAVVGVVGPNGAGKSTLIKCLSGAEAPTEGRVRIGETVVLATAAQSRDELDRAATNNNGKDASVFEAVCDGSDHVDLGGLRVPARQYVAWFGFSGSAQQKKVHMLSGGERNRAFLAKQLKSNANVLVLDEPTNDLDVSTLRALEDALLDFPGTVIAVSHDRCFLDRLATHILAFELVPPGTAASSSSDDDFDAVQVVFFEGNYQEYERDRRRRYGDALPKPVRYNRNQLVAA